MPALSNLLIRRSAFLAAVRQFFASRGVYEADTPLLREFAVTDPALTSLQADGGWLITSPEYALKDLLSRGAPDIYQLSHVFRGEEQGRKHLREFMLLEWYRRGFDILQLMQETADFIHALLPERSLPVKISTYAQCFAKAFNIDYFAADSASLAALAHAVLPESRSWQLDRSGWSDLLFTHAIEMQLGIGCLEFITDYPPEQAALARIRKDEYGRCTAARFEAYIDGLELCNGFYELTDAAEQAARFAADNAWRKANGLPEIPIDRNFLAALERGLPDCAGVALGIDRLFMLAENQTHIADVQLIK